jgi:hypothetical protein
VLQIKEKEASSLLLGPNGLAHSNQRREREQRSYMRKVKHMVMEMGCAGRVKAREKSKGSFHFSKDLL